MAIPFEDDLSAILNLDEFAVSATYRRARALGQSTISGIFDNETVPVDAGGHVAVHQEQPRFTCKTSDVPNISYDDAIIISEVEYYVRAWVHNGQGMSEIHLEKL